MAIIFQNLKPSISLSHATLEDTMLIYQWQCLPETRKYALNPQVPTWEEHQAWMTKKLQQLHNYFYIITDQTKKIGFIRLDKLYSNHYLISIFVDPVYHSKGIATSALQLINHNHPSISIHATVLKENVASHALFTKIGYKKINAEQYLRQPID